MSNLCLGIDIGSTTAKVVLRRGNDILFEKYERHLSAVREKTVELLKQVEKISGNEKAAVAISGSAGLGLSEGAGLPFAQEVYATGEVVKKLEPDTSAVIELGGEDAKIIFFDGGIDERMNGTCAGGTGAFIDQMATLLNVTADELDVLSLKHERLYPIASRCGVFAKTDIQPLLNQGAKKEDIAASIYAAVVNQTVAGLAQGKKIKGKVLFLGGPLYYCHGLQKMFKKILGLSDDEAVFPSYARFAVAYGASIYAEKAGDSYTIPELIEKIENAKVSKSVEQLAPLFETNKDYEDFCARHQTADVKRRLLEGYNGNAWLGIDCGSTTTKLALLDDNNELLYSYYASNRGDPVDIVLEQLKKIYSVAGSELKICGSAVTGYGEELIKSAFSADCGVVETIAHYTAAKYFMPDVDFILDIGGQDIKCFKIKNGAIDSIMLNEACSSGCGSFLETFARSLGMTVEEFARLALFAKHPSALGSRCTVFMNSAVKQAQKDGATVGDISAGLSISVVKNALYKVIRVSDPAALGKNIVVQGGTFYNDAVLRAFEREFGRNVVRPSISGLMGAYGAALYSKKFSSSTLLTAEQLKGFTHSSRSVICKGCTNRCHLTVNDFGSGKKFISGNRCEKGAGLGTAKKLPNLYEFKREYLENLPVTADNRHGTLGLPQALGMYELLPLWKTIFENLGFKTIVSGESSRAVYEKGQFSIPSDTVCYPAKLMHGHIAKLLEMGAESIFYPCLSYNVDEGESDNHYNCPVVAYYSELLSSNVEELEAVNFMYPYLNINDPKKLSKELYRYLKHRFGDITKSEVANAVKKGFEAYDNYINAVRKEGENALKFAKDNNLRVMILAGRPYHIDGEICHGIDKLANSLGFVVVSEDSVCHLADRVPNLHVLNQWTYHSRLYRAAVFAAQHKNVQLVQLVSFGCGVDAITTDEVRELLEQNGKFYTQLKIDEITNLGAVKIRLRSLIGALDEGGESE